MQERVGVQLRIRLGLQLEQVMAAYSLYELLRVLIDRVAWRTEAERNAAHESVNEAEQMNMFGNLAGAMACRHLNKRAGKCPDCGRGDIA